MFKLLYSGIFVSSLFFYGQPSNHPPVVKITQPVNHSVVVSNGLVPYTIEVSDKEDGESKYQEIPSTEVLLKSKYAENMSRVNTYLKQKKFNDTSGVMSMLVSNCFSCHGFKSKLAGPSLQEIALQYANKISIQYQLINHVQKGSTGIWGKEVMPSHPELDSGQVKKMVRWILNYANDPTLNYFVGLQGAIPISTVDISHRFNGGILILTAYYTDRGTTEFPNNKITGSDQVLIQIK
jgi:cytochrome c